MPRTITLRSSGAAYDAVESHAEADQQSMNSWIEGLLDVEDMRRRCAAHDKWMQERPGFVAFSEEWAERNLDELPGRWDEPCDGATSGVRMPTFAFW